MTGDQAPKYSDDIADLRHVMVNRILAGVTLLAAIGAPISILRVFFTGWLPLYAVHGVIAVFVILLWLLRKRVAYRVKLIIILILFWIIGVAGLFTLGLVGAGAWWLVTSALLVEVLYGKRSGYLAMSAVAAVVLVFAILFVSGLLQLSVDTNLFSQQAAAWATFAVGAVLQPLIVFSAVGALQGRIVQLNKRVIAQAEEIQLLADTDELTKLPRRHVAYDRLEQALRIVAREKNIVAVLFFDLNGFKNINDAYGHATGDRILQATADRARSCLRASDTIARIGGDEFLVILPGVGSVDDATLTANKLVAAISAPVGSEESELTVGASIGIALAPEHGMRAEDLVNAADHAMYAAKKAGNNQIRVAESTPN